ncbi:MAG: hypothetical protein LBD18_03145 [Treponema sp.]|jgi:hypothetical protein|nr:hypothetical protein [Treponema sp.]
MANLFFTTWLLTLGFIPYSSYEYNLGPLPSVARFDNTFVQTLEVDFYVANILRVYSNVEIREMKAQTIYFDPYRADFRIGAELAYKGFFLGVFHECDHDVVTTFERSRYNGIDGAFADIYAGWQGEFAIHPKVKLQPYAALGIRPYDNFFVLVEGSGSSEIGYPGSNLFAELHLGADLFDLVRLRAMFRPEFSLYYRSLACFQYGAGAELRYRNISLGVDWTSQVKLLYPAGSAVSELTIYISFRGQSKLL